MRKPHTMRVQFGPDPDKGRKQTRRYSRVGPLVITRSIEGKVEASEFPYVITHTASGMRITRTHKLAQARQALALLLPLTDWSQGKDKLEHDTCLLQRVRDAISSLGIQVTTRRY